MTWPRYGEFLVLVVVLVLIPGPDFALVTKNTIVGGRHRGRWTVTGVSMGNALQATAAACGLSALIVRAQPVFEVIKWAGAGYLTWLGVQALLSAARGRYAPLAPAASAPIASGGARRVAWRQGFLCNVTNPKVIVFYLAVLPPFIAHGAGIGWSLALAWTVPVLGMAYQFVLVEGMHRARAVLARRRVRRSLDAAAGVVLLGFATSLAVESV